MVAGQLGPPQHVAVELDGGGAAGRVESERGGGRRPAGSEEPVRHPLGRGPEVGQAAGRLLQRPGASVGRHTRGQPGRRDPAGEPVAGGVRDQRPGRERHLDEAAGDVPVVAGRRPQLELVEPVPGQGHLPQGVGHVAGQVERFEQVGRRAPGRFDRLGELDHLEPAGRRS